MDLLTLWSDIATEMPSQATGTRLCLQALTAAQGSRCLKCALYAARLVAMREEKVENMAHETTPASAKRQKRASAAAGAGSPSPYSTPPSVGAPTMSDDMYMLMDEDEKTSVSLSGGRSGGKSDKEILRVVTDGDSYDDGYRSATCNSEPFGNSTRASCNS